jgi:hypothetical protein
MGFPRGVGLPSAILGSAAVVRNRVIAAKASMNRFTVRSPLRKNSHRDTLQAAEGFSVFS